MMSHYLQWHWITSGRKKPTCCDYHSELEWITAADNGHLASPPALCLESPVRLPGYEAVMVQTVNNSRVIDWNQHYSFLIYMLPIFFYPPVFFFFFPLSLFISGLQGFLSRQKHLLDRTASYSPYYFFPTLEITEVIHRVRSEAATAPWWDTTGDSLASAP